MNSGHQFSFLITQSKTLSWHTGRLNRNQQQFIIHTIDIFDVKNPFKSPTKSQWLCKYKNLYLPWLRKFLCIIIETCKEAREKIIKKSKFHKSLLDLVSERVSEWEDCKIVKFWQLMKGFFLARAIKLQLDNFTWGCPAEK